MTHPSRITLSRIIAVNWYGYRQFIDIHGLSLITGANGSGKSVLLDLIQFVILGEQNSRFNKAAAGAGSGRNLRGYCLCDTNTTGRDGQERYLRQGGVTIAALEFEIPASNISATPEHQTWGARIEFESPSARGRLLWFKIPRRLERSDFLRKDLIGEDTEFLAEDEFRVHVKRDLDGDTWEHQRTYLEEMRLRNGLHFDREQMTRTLPKAMAFQPENNFEQFIREHLLDAALPDVKAVKASVDAHRRAQERLEKMHDQHQRLVRIGELHVSTVGHRREAALWAHLKEALAHEEALEKLETTRRKQREIQEENARLFQDREEAVTERNQLRIQLDEVRMVVGQDSQAARLKEDRDRLARVQEELKDLRQSRKTASEFLQTLAMHWRDWLRHGAALGVETPADVDEELAIIRGHDEAKGLDAVARLTRQGDELIREASDKLRQIDSEIRKAETRETELERDLEHYREGRSAPTPLLDALRAKGQKAVALGRSIEVKPEAEAWWPLLESLLVKDRQAILPEDFQAAWEEAHRTPSPAEPLINLAELRKQPADVRGGSLREYFEVKHPAASDYLDHLLGDVMPVEHLSGLDQHERALCKDGWLKDPPRRERLLPSKDLTLGEEGLRRMRQVREEELHAVREELEQQRRQRNDWRSWVNRAEEQRLVKPTVPAVGADLRRLPEAEKERLTLEETVRLLATPEREATVEKLRKLEATERGASERAIRLDERVKQLDQQLRELSDRITSQEDDEREALLQRQVGRAALTGVLESELTERIGGARAQYNTWQQRRDTAAELARQNKTRADECLRLRNEARQAFLLAHPEMADVFDPADDDNTRYDLRCRELAEQELARYTAEADRARAEWEERLQHQVLDVLRDKINEAERTKRELNKAMQHDIGGIRYQITSSKDRAHSAIWTLIDSGIPTGAELVLFNAAQREEVEKAKQELMAAIEAADNPEDKRGRRVLDYRFYHHWDIEARPVGRGDEAAISLNRSAKKQSGGENQAPFFVATLAAFHRVYDVSGPNGPPTLGLVVMDEAFSKLSGDRIDDCLALARSFGLQLVMAFPEDRLPTMIEHAETIVQCRVDREYEPSGAVRDIQNWVVRVDRERVREVL